MANYQLGVFVNATEKRLESHDLLSEAEYDKYKEADRLIQGFLSDYQQFEQVRRSYADYRQLIDHYSQKFSVRPRVNVVVTTEMNHVINSRLRTFFTEFRFFLDYAERMLKRQYGKTSAQANELKRATNIQFDNSFSYRFVYQLRSYAQHINLPINALSLQSGEFDFLTATTKHNLLVETDRDELLNSGFDWRAIDVRPQLRSLPAKFELNTYIEEMMECLEKIHVAFVSIGLPHTKRGAAYVKDLVKPLSSRGKPCIYQFDVPEDTALNQVSKFATRISWIQVELAELIANLPEPATLSRLPAFKVNITTPS